MSYNFTCIGCRVAFLNAEIQRQHYKTDWHRYNLKRKVVNLPPVTSEDFQQRVLQQREKDEVLNTSVFCKVCRKSFGSAAAFENHLNSKKHKDSLISFVSDGSVDSISEPLVQSRKETNKDLSDPDTEDSEIEEVDSDEWDDDLEEISENNPILKNNCLFCNHHSASMMKNLKHMSSEHSFFIPDIEYIVDLKGLLLYLGEKICKFYMCLWCNCRGREFHSIEAAQTHMRDKGHCKMLHEGETLAEYEPYYNYSQSYPDHENDMDIDQEITLPEFDGDDFQLTLPSGATVGHRALVKYYKQHFGPNHVTTFGNKSKINKVLSSYRALGWTSTDKMAVQRKARDIKFMKMVHAKYFMQLGLKSNKLQKHFRPQGEMDDSDEFAYVYPIKEENYDEVIEHLRCNFFPNEVMNKALNIVKSGEAHELLESHAIKTLKDNLSVMAIHCPTKKIAGVSLNGIMRRGDPEKALEELKEISDEKYRIIFCLLATYNASINIFDKAKSDELFEIRILSADPTFKGKGIGCKLMNVSEDICCKEGFKVLKADCTGAFSQKIAEKLNYDLVFSKKYEDITDENGKQIIIPEPPHIYFQIFIKRISD